MAKWLPKRMKLVSDGTARGTQILDHEGFPISMETVERVEYTVGVKDRFARLTVTHFAECEVYSGAEDPDLKGMEAVAGDSLRMSR